MNNAIQGRHLAAALVAAAAFAPACDSEQPEPSRAPTEDPIVLPGPASVEVDVFGAPTTSGTIALANLNGQIESHESLVAKSPEDTELMAALVGLLLTRTQFVGSYDDFSRALELASKAVALEPDNGETHALLAAALSSVHRFDEALAAVNKAEKLGVNVDERRETIELARGENLITIESARAQRAVTTPSYETLTALASVEAALGHYDDADGHFIDALKAYNDVSPMPVAWVSFQRGVMWAEQAGRSDLAKPLYAEAVRRLPGYIVANVHLSELEVAQDELDQALDRLEQVRTTTADPEPTGYLAELLLDLDPPAAHNHASWARTRYDALLGKHPEAFADHGSEFFAGPAGADPGRALDLALLNLDNRENPRAYIVAIGAARAAEQQGLACSLADQAGEDSPNIVLRLTQQEVRQLGCP